MKINNLQEELNTIQIEINNKINLFKELINNFNINSNYEIYLHKKYNENDNQYIERGENIINKTMKQLQINEVMIQKEKEITEMIEQTNKKLNKIFSDCKENKIKLIEKNNENIEKVIDTKKKLINKTNKNKEQKMKEIKNYKEQINVYRFESIEMKNKREMEEMLEEIKQEKKELHELIIKLEKTKQQIENNPIEHKIAENNPFTNIFFSRNEKEEPKQENKNDFNGEIEILNENEMLDINEIKMAGKLKEMYNLSEEEMNQIEIWSNKKMGYKIFDTQKDNWSVKTSVFNDRIMNKSKLLFIIEDSIGNKFGAYVDTKTEERYKYWINTNTNTFLFSLKSNGRIKEGMMKFECISGTCGYYLYENHDFGLINLGGATDLYLQKYEHRTICHGGNQIKEPYYNYHGYKNALFGDQGNFTLKRMIVVQMK